MGPNERGDVIELIRVCPTSGVVGPGDQLAEFPGLDSLDQRDFQQPVSENWAIRPFFRSFTLPETVDPASHITATATSF
jgi:hypothetical protein